MSSLQKPQDNIIGRTDDIPASMDVASSVLDPIVITNTNARFVLENKGILSRDSVLQFQLVVETANSRKAFLPTSAGIFSLIKSATLRIGARRISDVKDLGFYKAMAHSYDTPDFRNNKTRLLTGINTVYNPCPVAPTAAGAGMFSHAGAQVASEGDTFQDYAMELTDSTASTPCWSVKLSDLFPVLLSIELPLFLLKEEVAIDLVFNQQVALDQPVDGVGTLCCFEDAGGAPPANMVLGTCSLVKHTCLLYLDTIYYANERMEEEAARVNAKNGMFLDYSDLIQNVAALPAISGLASGSTEMTSQAKTDQVPLSGFMVKNLFWAYTVSDWLSVSSPAQPAVLSYKHYNQFYGKYALLAFRKDDTFDCRVNDLLVFPEPVTSATHKATEAEACMGGQVWLNQGVWSYNAVTTKSGLYPVDPKASLFPTPAELKVWGAHMDLSQLQGKQSFVGINLSNSYGNSNNDAVLINQKPIEIIHSSLPVSPTDNYKRTTYYYAEVVKRFGIEDGRCVIFQGPAVDTAR